MSVLLPTPPRHPLGAPGSQPCPLLLPSGTHHPARTDYSGHLSEPHGPAALPGPGRAHAPHELAEGWGPSGSWEPQVGARRGGLQEDFGSGSSLPVTKKETLLGSWSRKVTSHRIDKGGSQITRTGTPLTLLICFSLWCPLLHSSLSLLVYTLSCLCEHGRYPLSTPNLHSLWSMPAFCDYQTQILKACNAIGPACVMDHPLSAGLPSTAWPLGPFSK